MTTAPPAPDRPIRLRPDLIAAAAVTAALLWAYWPTLAEMVERWSHDPRYSHGFLVPAFSLYLLWDRRAWQAAAAPDAWGLALLALGAAMFLAGSYFYFVWLIAVSLLPCLAGLAVLVGGWPCLARAWPAVAFLIFMIPLPYRLEMSLGYPLQRIATLASNYALQTLGLPAVAEGNIILIDEARIGVVEACNGLGMMFMFFAFAVGAAFVIRRPVVDRVAIILGAIPTALLANVTRITVTGLLHVTVGGVVADHVYHDLAGWLMMPLAMGMLWLELWLLAHMFVESPGPRAVPFLPVAGPGGVRGPLPDRPAAS